MELSQPCLRESVRAPCTSKNQTQCTWMGLKYQTNSGVLKLTIPVGDLNHSTLVMMLTFLATGVSSFYLVTVMFQKSKEFHFVLFLARRTGMPANETNQLHLGKDRGDSAQPQRASLETRKSHWYPLDRYSTHYGGSKATHPSRVRGRKFLLASRFLLIKFLSSHTERIDIKERTLPVPFHDE
ncbi:unnamed protein product, partial [Cyprideis torosa]